METFETFSTTADVGIRIQGKGYKGLFTSALKGLNLLLFGDETGNLTAAGSRPHRFEFKGDSAENILVNLLSEILFLLQSQNKITVGIDIVKAEETRLVADLLLNEAKQAPEVEIKSVTYHNLKINEKKGIKSADIIFDI